MAKPKLAATPSRLSSTEVRAMVRLRKTTSSRTNAVAMIRPMASGAASVRASVRSWFWAPGPPTAAEGAAASRSARRRPTRSEVAWESTAVVGVTRTTDRPVAAFRSDDSGVGHAGVRRGQRHDLLGGDGVDGHEQRCGGAGAEGLDDQLVAVAAGAALVDHPGPGHAEAHAEGGHGQQAEQEQAQGQRAPRAAQGPAGPAGPTALGRVVGVDHLALAHGQHPVPEGAPARRAAG